MRWEELTSLAQKGGKIYNTMTGAYSDSSTILEDFRVSEIPPSAKLSEKYRQRCYGVLLDEKPKKNGAEIRVPELWMFGLGSLDRVFIQKVEQPPDCHPGLESLWREDDHSIDIVRYGHNFSIY